MKASFAMLVFVSSAAMAAASEQQAIGIVAKAMRRLDPTPPYCLLYETESRTHRSFQIAVREKNEPPCPGDPGVAPV